VGSGGLNYIPTVLPCGDSITQSNGANANGGWRQPLWTAGQGAQPFWFVGPFFDGSFADPMHLGISGITIANLLVQEETGFGTYSPDIAIRQAGINDIGIEGTDAATTVARMSTELDQMFRASTKPWFRVICLSLLKCITGSASLEPTVLAANALIPAMIAGKSYASRVTFIGEAYHGALNNSDTGAGADYQSGGLHPSDAGDNKLAAVIWANGLSAAVAAVVTGRI
jgi:hypothetical protein